MRVEPVSVARFQVEEGPGRCTIVVPPVRNWLLIAFLSCWLGGWSFGELTTASLLLSGRADAFTIFWLGGWTLGGAFVIYTIIQMLAGRQCISVGSGVLEISDEVAGFARRKRYAISNIVHLRPAAGSSDWGVRRSWLPPAGASFDYGAATVEIAPGVTEAEARMLIERLRAHGVDTAG